MSKHSGHQIDLCHDVHVKFFVDAFGKHRSVGELWSDRANNECYFRDNGTLNVRTINNDPSLTIQSEAEKCDLEICRAIYAKSGVMNNIRTDQPKYGDFTSSRDYHDVLMRAQQAQDDFMTLDAHIRARFDNDPGKLLDYVANPKNRSEAIKLGLLTDSDPSPQALQVPQGEGVSPA